MAVKVSLGELSLDGEYPHTLAEGEWEEVRKKIAYEDEVTMFTMRRLELRAEPLRLLLEVFTTRTKRLQRLHVEECLLSPGASQALAMLTKVSLANSSSLSISKTKLGDPACIALLSSAPPDCCISMTDAGLAAAGMAAAVARGGYVNISRNSAGDEGFTALADALCNPSSKSRPLHVLDVSGNNLSTSGLLALAAKVTPHPSVSTTFVGALSHLHTLDFSQNALGNDALGPLVVLLTCLQNLSVLRMNGVSVTSDSAGAEVFAALSANCPSLSVVEFTDNSGLMKHTAQAIVGLVKARESSLRELHAGNFSRAEDVQSIVDGVNGRGLSKARPILIKLEGPGVTAGLKSQLATLHNPVMRGGGTSLTSETMMASPISHKVPSTSNTAQTAPSPMTPADSNGIRESPVRNANRRVSYDKSMYSVEEKMSDRKLRSPSMSIISEGVATKYVEATLRSQLADIREEFERKSAGMESRVELLTKAVERLATTMLDRRPTPLKSSPNSGERKLEERLNERINALVTVVGRIADHMEIVDAAVREITEE